MIMMTDFIHALSHFHKIWAPIDWNPCGVSLCRINGVELPNKY